MENKIVTIEEKKDEKFLRKKTAEFDFKKFSRKETGELINRMKKAMKLARGVGLSANQIGLDMRVFVASVPKDEERGAGPQRFYAIFNPQLTRLSKERETVEEGCLSVPGVYGNVARSAKLVLEGFDKSGKKIKIKAWGLLARVFQHEIDHLDGKLFVDKADKLYRVSSIK